MFRMEKHLKDKGLSDKVMSIAEANAIGNMDNIAADWELSARGYDEDDKEVVRHMTLAGRVIGGLILEDDRPEWKNLTLEELFDKLYDERKQQQQKEKEKKNSAQIDVEEETHSPDYVAMYNKIVAKYDDPAYSDGDITLLVSRLTRGEDFDL